MFIPFFLQIILGWNLIAVFRHIYYLTCRQVQGLWGGDLKTKYPHYKAQALLVTWQWFY